MPIVNSNQLADAGNLSALKQAAAHGNPQALREAARQFESLFTSMMLKSMQEANFKDPVFGSDQGDLYQEMYDDQVAAEMSKGKGLGLADMLVRQLRGGSIGGGDPVGMTPSSSVGAAPAAPSSGTSRAGASATAVGATASTAGVNGTAGTTTASAASANLESTTATTTAATDAPSACPTSAQQAAFAQGLWPEAQQAARQLGVNPVTLLAQAALETNWGRSVPQDAGGGTSNNLFGIKATPGWSGPAVTNSTREYSGGLASTVKAQFRSYGSASHCFQDYVDLLKSNPRYAAALGTGNDVQAFGSALQQGGYATDPAYASKLTAVAGTLAHALTHPAAGSGSSPSASLKFAADLPTTDGSGTLHRR
ncbi:MAG: flagellar assembly peptidoglycan hydrolase FlgJ [Gammaproteobacteria bacterium]|nr:flagellar assembly peptidoglycan hydrolase FlgJ [Gammaproteobacteria bacterium]